MKQFIKMISFFVIFFSMFGCAYRYYLGFPNTATVLFFSMVNDTSLKART